MNPIDLQQIAIEAMRSRGLLPAFAPQALQEAEDARQAKPERSGAIRDLRHMTWFSFDNDDTRDLDQLSVAEPLAAGSTRLLVAVADVDTKVAPGGAVDDHAAANTTSVYTAAGVFPMLPETLSNDLTSLHEDQERLAVVVDMQVEANGTVSESSVYRAAVLNRAKLTYDGVSAWLDGLAPAPPQLASVEGLEDQLRWHDALAGKLRQWRQTRGAAIHEFVFSSTLDRRAALEVTENRTWMSYAFKRDFQMLRRSLLPPIPEYEVAATLLSQAADALLLDDWALCEQLLCLADLRSLCDFAYLVCGPINPKIHRQTANPIYVRREQSKSPRMPSAAVTREVFAQDGYRCRFCNSKVIVKEAQKVFSAACPNSARWSRTNDGKHCGLATLTASVDHLVPFGRGGTNDRTNLVTACGPCQFGRNQWTLEEVELEDPSNLPPIVDTWDGLSRLIGFKALKSAG